MQCGALNDGAVFLFAYVNHVVSSFVCRKCVLVGQWPEWRQ